MTNREWLNTIDNDRYADFILTRIPVYSYVMDNAGTKIIDRKVNYTGLGVVIRSCEMSGLNFKQWLEQEHK